MIIAIDGPAASGKGTLARRLAARFGLAYLDTGSLYRAVGRAVLRAGLWDPANHVDLAEIPTPGDVLAAQTQNRIDGKAYDTQWPERAAKSMW